MQHKQFDPSRITTRREALKLSQSQLAAAVGVSHVTVFRWENGLSKPEADSMARLAFALRRSAAYFFVDPGAAESPEGA